MSLPQLFPLVTDDGFAGDVELLYIALKYNLAIRRIPVRLLRTGPTTVSVVAHSLPMLTDHRRSAAPLGVRRIRRPGSRDRSRISATGTRRADD